MKLKTVKEGGSWFVVSTIYEPPMFRSVGSGVKWCEPHPTRAAARAAIKRLYEEWKQ
jgi:hypothetical protein